MIEVLIKEAESHNGFPGTIPTIPILGTLCMPLVKKKQEALSFLTA